jgi:hypothetical protein
VATIFAQTTERAARDQWRIVADQLRERFPKIARLIDTADSAIRKALVVYLDLQKQEAAKPSVSSKGREIQRPTEDIREFDPEAPPDLTHASFLTGSVGGNPVNKWNYLVIEAHAQAFKALRGDLASLQRISEAHIRPGETTESGFRPVKNCGFSVQGVESNKAWAFSQRLAKKFGFPLTIEFRWQQKDGAAFPGELGRMSWEP